MLWRAAFPSSPQAFPCAPQTFPSSQALGGRFYPPSRPATTSFSLESRTPGAAAALPAGSGGTAPVQSGGGCGVCAGGTVSLPTRVLLTFHLGIYRLWGPCPAQQQLSLSCVSFSFRAGRSPRGGGGSSREASGKLPSCLPAGIHPWLRMNLRTSTFSLLHTHR